MTIPVQDARGALHGAQGLYAEKGQSVPEVKLESQNPEGSFLFPVEHSDVQSYCRFWMSVPISDGVLSNVVQGYAELVRYDAVLDSSEWSARWDFANKKDLDSKSESTVRRALDRRDAEWEEHYAEWCAGRQMRIRPNDARNIARAGQLAYFRGQLSEQDQQAVLESTLRVNDSEATVNDIALAYRLDEIREFFQDPEATAAEKLEDLRLELRRMQLQPSE